MEFLLTFGASSLLYSYTIVSWKMEIALKYLQLWCNLMASWQYQKSCNTSSLTMGVDQSNIWNISKHNGLRNISARQCFSLMPSPCGAPHLEGFKIAVALQPGDTTASCRDLQLCLPPAFCPKGQGSRLDCQCYCSPNPKDKSRESRGCLSLKWSSRGNLGAGDAAETVAAGGCGGLWQRQGLTGPPLLEFRISEAKR